MVVALAVVVSGDWGVATVAIDAGERGNAVVVSAGAVGKRNKIKVLAGHRGLIIFRRAELWMLVVTAVVAKSWSLSSPLVGWDAGSIIIATGRKGWWACTVIAGSCGGWARPAGGHHQRYRWAWGWSCIVVVDAGSGMCIIHDTGGESVGMLTCHGHRCRCRCELFTAQLGLESFPRVVITNQ